MKHIRKHKLRLPLAFLLSLLLIFEGMSVAVFATDTTDTMASTEADTGMLVPEPPDMVVEDIESDVIISPPDISGADDEQASVNATTSQPFADGIYAFRNVGNNGIYMDTQYDSSSPGYKLQQYAYSPSPLQTFANGGFANGGIFKLSYRADLGTYVMRSMTNNLLSYTFSSDNYVITHEIPADDADVAPEDTFEFVRQPSGYVIQKYNSDDCIAAQNSTASGAAGAPYSYLIKGTMATSGAQAHWRLFHYTTYDAPTRYGFSMAQEPNTYIAGNQYNVNIKTWSTVINANLPYAKMSNATVQYLSGTWNSSTRKILLSAHDEGNAKLFIYVRDGSNADIHTIEVIIPVELPFKEGTYYLRNLGADNFMQTQVNNNTNGSFAKLYKLDSTNSQKWIFEHVRDGYYKIKSKYNNLYLSIPDGGTHSTGINVTLETSNNYTRQQWKFENTSYDRYIIRCRASTSYCINVISTANGTNITQNTYTSNNDWLDEWHIALIGSESSIACEIQQKSKWCWVASARMFSKNYYPSVTLTQEDAVIHLKGSAVNVGGYLSDKQNAINYFLTGIVSPPVLDTVAYSYHIYDEETIRQFLDDGHVLAISLYYYSDLNDSSTQNGGHGIVLYGYCKIGEEYRYLIHDPWLSLEKNSSFISYEKLYWAANPQYEEEESNTVWGSTIVLNTSYDNETIPFYFDREE